MTTTRLPTDFREFLRLLNSEKIEYAGVTFPDCYARRVKHLLDGVEVDVIQIDDLIVNKQAAGRPKDLMDVAALRKRKQLGP